MSLTSTQREQTARELARNAELSGMAREALADRAGIALGRYDAALRADAADPADVWLVRDVLESAVREAGAEPIPYTVLTEEMRPAAGRWFGVTDRR